MRLKTVIAMLGMGLAGAVTASPGMAGDVYVIVHPGVTLAPGEIREVYLGEKQFSGELKLVPVDNAAVQSDFLGKVVNMDVGKYGSLWTKKGFREGLIAPATKFGDAEVASFVKNTPGAVGYISAPATGVKVLQKY